MISIQALDVTRYIDKKVLHNSSILIGINIIFIMICLIPAVKNTSRLSSQLKELENNLVRSRRKIDNYPQMLAEKKQLTAYVNQYLERLINEGAKTRLIGDVSDLAKRCNVTIVSMRPQPYKRAVPEGFSQFFKPLSYELTLEAGYHEFGTFLNLLEHFDILVAVEQLTIEPQEDNEAVHKITLILTTYAKV